MDRLGGEGEDRRSCSTRLSLGGSGAITGRVGGRVNVTGRWDHLPPLPDTIGTDKQGVADNQFGGGEIRLLTDTDGRGVRVERGRQGRVGCKVVNETIPGCFMENRLPLGVGGTTMRVVAFIVSSISQHFPREAEKTARKSRSEKSAAGKIVVRQGPISVEPGLEAGRVRMQSTTTRLRSRSEPNHSVSRYGFLSL